MAENLKDAAWKAVEDEILSWPEDIEVTMGHIATLKRLLNAARTAYAEAAVDAFKADVLGMAESWAIQFEATISINTRRLVRLRQEGWAVSIEKFPGKPLGYRCIGEDGFWRDCTRDEAKALLEGK